MKVLLDTSTLVAAFLTGHPEHEPAFAWLEAILEGEHQGLVSTHTLAELYAVLTRIPSHPALTPDLALRLVEENLRTFTPIPLGPEDYWEALRRLTALGLGDGVVYDALIAQAALKGRADLLLTLNPKDFLRLGEDIAAKVHTPRGKPPT